MRRRSGTNPGETGATGAVNGGQADGGGSGLLAGGAAAGDGLGMPGPASQDTDLRSNPSSSQWASPGYPAASGGNVSAGADSDETPSPAGAQDALPQASMVRAAPPQPRQPSATRSRFALVNWRVRWRLAAVIAVPTLTAAVLGALTINGDVNKWEATGRVQHLAQLNSDVVSYSQALEDELNLSAAFAATRTTNSNAHAADLKKAQNTTDTAANAVLNDSSGVTAGAGYLPGTVQDLNAVRASISDLANIRTGVTKTQFPASQIIRVYSDNLIMSANTFSAAIGNGANDADLQGDVTSLGALLRNENQVAVQRAILYAALVSPQGTLRSEDLATLQQAHEQAVADLANFNASSDTTLQQKYSNTVSGAQVDVAASTEILAEQMATATPNVPLRTQLKPENWNADMALTIRDTQKVADQLAAEVTDHANALRSDATTDLLVTSLVTLLLLLLVVLVSTIVARSLIRPLRKLRSDALDVAGHRLPEMVRRLSQSEGADEGVEIEPIGVTSTDEIGEVARAFDQVHREAVRLAADEAMLRGNLNAMFINLSRRSQSLIERQLSLIDSLEQSEQDPGRLSSLFRLDHLATRMRRNSENLLVLAGHEVTRRWSQPVPLVDVLRAAISEIEQYERVVLNVQPGIVVVGQAVNDVVHLVAEIVENATTFSPEDTQVYVSGQPLSSGGVLLDITDNGVGISDQEMSHANWRLDNPPVVDVAVSRRMGLFVVGRLAARHGVRVRLRHAQAGGLTALIWLPDTVAAPEVAPPLGRLRRFEADDYGPTPSLSAPTATIPPQGSAAASQATAAARIPRFSPSAPSGPSAPAAPAAPSFTPAANEGAPGSPPGPAGPAGPAGPGADVPGIGAPAADAAGQPAKPAVEGTPAGNNWEPAGNGWDLGNGQAIPGHQDGPPTQALPVRNGNGNGNAAGGPRDQRDDTEPSAPAAGGPSRLPAFGGAVQPPQSPQFPVGSQNIHGSDGPSAGSATNGAAGPAPGEQADGQVTVPPAGPQRLPIFDSLESDWFRRSGTTMTGPQRALSSAAQPPASQAAWTSPADEGWRAAQVVASPAAGETTQAGLPRRVPRANLVPGSVGSGGTGSQDEVAEAPARSADAVRSRMSSFQRGVREGRAAAPQTEEP
ncbi:MAG TPA: nitrate- and nitrite sensing domain-containing protein [Streptosporangiaceae bacterium]|nr:nitrate- and nitrite sensing domain-containing protein [Streptosporangiaceae bacterium]